jgi:hypothetical protein
MGYTRRRQTKQKHNANVFDTTMHKQTVILSCYYFLSIVVMLYSIVIRGTYFLYLGYLCPSVHSQKYTFSTIIMVYKNTYSCLWDRRGRDRMVFGFTITYAISAYHH